ncbi:hypothetical protein KM176_22860 [Pseudooceanicola sp. CBS1P-1]|uniref:Transporter n=1 Tax=Pseudooceanicola albus TaxID=2692189 RepID=A0A6L7GC30_9RHOB|nr:MULTISPECIES: hypothetical protein [Pseudooceanicola]MBT9386706.1 hypothetical protein [Pseudooceanicola endophyticus]MXN20810.1 hypothetical protein [Pseudooceanicola albus]
MTLKQLCAALLAGAACTLGTAARAQQAETLSAGEYLGYLTSLAQASESPVPRGRSGASTIGIPSGFTLPQGTVFAAGALSNIRGRSSEDTDGSGAVGFGLGDAEQSVGLEVVLGISSVDPQDFGDSGSLALKLARRVPAPFPGGAASVAVGVGRLGTWGDVDGLETDYYAMASSTFYAGRMPGLVSIGYGSAIGTFEDSGGMILGAGLGVLPWLSAGASWYGDEALAGLVAATTLPGSDIGVQLGISYGDVTHANSDGRWVLSLAFVKTGLF